jgi:hypothetical protein
MSTFQAQQLRQASPDKSTPELRMRVGPLPPTPGQAPNSTPPSSASSRSQPSGGDASSPPVAPPRVESLVFIGRAGGVAGGDAAPPLPARNSDSAPAPPPRNLGGHLASGLPPPPPKLPRPVSHESLNSVPVGGHGHQRRGSHAALPPPTPPFRGGGTAEQVSPPGGRSSQGSHTRTRSSPVSLEQTLGEYKLPVP